MLSLSELDLSKLDLRKLGRDDRIAFAALLSEYSRRQGQKKFFGFYPDEGPLARQNYPKHMEFFEAGATYRERCFRAANRVGKTEGGGGYELTAHLTGLYPDWWVGRRFDRPVSAWAAGRDATTTRDIIQRKLLGPVYEEGGRKACEGTGMIPGYLHGKMSMQTGIRDAIDTIRVRHEPTGGWSLLGFKAYAQGASSFEGTEQDVIWLDEEPPMDVYGECLIRTAGTADRPDGIIMLTFTPLEGLSHVVLQFTPKDERPDLGET